MSKKTPAAKAANYAAAAEKPATRRNNGKAWKKGADGVSAPPEQRVKKAVVKTPERKLKDEAIKAHRERRRELGVARARTRREAEAEARLRASEELQIASARDTTRTTAVTKLKKAVKS